MKAFLRGKLFFLVDLSRTSAYAASLRLRNSGIGWVGTYARVGAYASFKKLPLGGVV
jgi:hypothetical protein